MIEFENYKTNLDFIDKYDLKNIKVKNSIIYTGNTDYIFEKKRDREYTSPLLAAAVLGLDNTAAPIPPDSKFFDVWTDIDAQEIFLNTKPTCYLIYSKPGVGAYNLGEALSKKLNCVHLCPRNLIMDEFEQKSSVGKILDFNMRHNKPCSIHTILSMLKMKLKSPAIQHRGYVISDLPLVTCSKETLYFVNSLESEEAYLVVDELLFDVICNLKKKKRKPVTSPHTSVSSASSMQGEFEEEEEEEDDRKDDQQAEEAVEEEEDLPAVLPKYLLDPCSNIIVHKKAYYTTKQAILMRQIQEVFSLCLTPDVIIRLTCPDVDLVKLRTYRYINYKTGQNTTEPFIPKVSSDLRWPAKYRVSDYVSPYDSHVFNPKYNCKSPMNFKNKSSHQICNYQKYIMSYLRNKFKDYDPKMIFELDGRSSLHHMMHNITERLLLLKIQPVIIPEPLHIEEPPEDMEQFWEVVSGLNMIRSGDVNFKRCSSPWYTRCPVELKLRRSVVGNPKYAVSLFKHVYLMSSLNNFITFCRNPRPFLKLQYLEPTCRVIVTGTKSSGKSMICHCLSWIFNTPIIQFIDFLENEKHRKYETFARSILSEIIATIEDARIRDWQLIESDRVTKLNSWCTFVLQLLSEYYPLLVKRLKYKEKQAELLKQEEEKVEEAFVEEEEQTEEEDGEQKDVKKKKKSPKVDKILEEDLSPIEQEKFNDLRIKLASLPFLDSVEECELTISSKNVIEYAPIELTTVPNKPSIPALGDEDVTVAISRYIEANDLQKELVPTSEELMSELIKVITKIDQTQNEKTKGDQLYGKYIIDGFPSDPEFWGYLNDPKLIPDYTIAIIENKEINQDLMQYYINVDKYTKHYDEKILAARDPLITTKLVNVMPIFDFSDDAEIIVEDFINDALDFIFITLKNQADSEPHVEDKMIASFSEAIDKFREDWDSIKLKLEEKSKCYIEVELENKSDPEIIQEVLLKFRKCYTFIPEPNEDEDAERPYDEEDEANHKDLLSYNDSKFRGETNIYCPVAFYDYGILWEGKPEFSLKYENTVYNFCKEEFLEKFRTNKTKYQCYNLPYKKLPKTKICVIGAIGSGASTLSKQIAKELGLLYINFADIINFYMLPRHFKDVGRHYENIFTDEPFDEEGVVEFQMGEENENLMSDILSNETEMRRMVYNYYERGAPMIPQLMQKMIKKIWFDPFVPTGFVLDGYPRLPNDIEDMLAMYCIPDIILDLECNIEVALSRIGPLRYNIWKAQRNEAKRAAKTKLDSERAQWLSTITKKIVTKLIIEEVLENMFLSRSDPIKGSSAESLIMDAHPSGLSNVDPVLFNTYNEMILENPEPQDSNVWEKADDARERINARVEALFDTDFENIDAMKELIMEHRFKLVTIDATKPANKVFRMTLSKLMTLKNRNESFFEQTFIVKPDIAEMLILHGFYFLSKFNRLCPVYIDENPNSILNSYKPSRSKGLIFPVVHRAYIYFISSVDYVTKFRSNPLKYITSNAIKSYFEYPLRMSIIGTPKSGQSTLSAKIAKRNGLLCITKGAAIRNILENLHWTELASKMEKYLEKGITIDDDLVVKAVITLAVDHRTVTYGFVFDGFPTTPYQAQGFLKNGIYPNVIFDLSVLSHERQKVFENSQNEIYNDIIKYKPPYPLSLIQCRYKNWTRRRTKIRTWIALDYQNLILLDANQSKWHVLQQANDQLKQLASKIHFYVCNVDKHIVRAICINNESFQERQSQYKNFCPVCFHQKVYKNCDYPGNKKGVVQYKNKFYWICDDHLEMVMMFPHCYLFPMKIDIPETAAIVKTVNTQYVYENGVCIVTYAENLPAQKIVMGTNQFAAGYAGKTYLFCSLVCLNKFLAKPQLFNDITVFQESKSFPRLCLKKLPNIGYLEQTLGTILTEACCAVNVLRPKYPGLSFQLSAFIYIGLFLKTHNPLMDEEKQKLYHRTLTIFEARCKMLLNTGLLLRSMDNPFAVYPKCYHPEPTMRPDPNDIEQFYSMQIQRPSNISHRASNYVQIHKPSLIHPLHRASGVVGQMQRP